jgi:hypothetical protein
MRSSMAGGGRLRLVVGGVLTALLLAAAATAALRGRIYHGNGGKTLAPFRVAAPSTLRWNASGGIFQIFNSNISSGGGVNSQASAGATYLKPGRYELQVNAIGSWTIRIAAGVEHPTRIGPRVGFKGNGGRDLPPVVFRHSGQLVWRASGGIFQIFDSNLLGGVAVNSQAGHGTTYVHSGKHQLTVNALGAWTISWPR